MSLREDIGQPGQTQGPRCAIKRYSDAYPDDRDDFLAMVADVSLSAQWLSDRLAEARGWRIPGPAIRRHRHRICGCYQRLKA